MEPTYVVLTSMKSLLPPSDIFNYEGFELPTFQFDTMYDIYKLYGCNEVDDEVLTDKNCRNLKQRPKKLRLLFGSLWFLAVTQMIRDTS